MCLVVLPRWKASELPIKSSESTISLASILMDSGNGNSDEFFLLVQALSKQEDPDTGQRMGTLDQSKFFKTNVLYDIPLEGGV